MDMVPQDINKRILNFEFKNARIENDILILIGSNEIVSKYLTDIYNNSKDSSTVTLIDSRPKTAPNPVAREQLPLQRITHPVAREK